MSEPLAGLRVVVTRSPDQASALAERLATLGAQSLLFPVIEFSPLPAPAFDAIHSQLDRYDWLIFTSVNAVQFFFGRFRPLDLKLLPPIAAVGSATSEALVSRGITPAFVPSEFTGEALALGLRGLSPDKKHGVDGKRVLLPRARVGRPEIVQLLQAQGVEVDEIALYDTVTASPPPEAFAELARGFDAIIFTSPSSVRNFLILIRPHPAIIGHLDQAIITAIGPITADAARGAGLSVAVTPPAYTIEGVVDALASHCASPAAPVPND